MTPLVLSNIWGHRVKGYSMITDKLVSAEQERKFDMVLCVHFLI